MGGIEGLQSLKVPASVALNIENRQQMSFLESMLELLEEELGIFDGFIWYWIGIKLFTEFCENGKRLIDQIKGVLQGESECA